jgi:hypothetical protein
MYIWTLYAHAKYYKKQAIFVGCEDRQKSLIKDLFYHRLFSFLLSPHKSLFSQTTSHVECEDVYTSFEIFYFLKHIKYAFQIKGAHPEAKCLVKIAQTI